jgi:hypothetical protein
MHKLKLIRLHSSLQTQCVLEDDLKSVVNDVLVQSVCLCELDHEFCKECKSEEGRMAVFKLSGDTELNVLSKLLAEAGVNFLGIRPCKDLSHIVNELPLSYKRIGSHLILLISYRGDMLFYEKRVELRKHSCCGRILQ